MQNPTENNLFRKALLLSLALALPLALTVAAPGGAKAADIAAGVRASLGGAVILTSRHAVTAFHPFVYYAHAKPRHHGGHKNYGRPDRYDRQGGYKMREQRSRSGAQGAGSWHNDRDKRRRDTHDRRFDRRDDRGMERKAYDRRPSDKNNRSEDRRPGRRG